MAGLSGVRNRAGLGLVVSVIVLWYAIYLDAALNQLRAEGFDVRDADTARVSPLSGTIRMCGQDVRGDPDARPPAAWWLTTFAACSDVGTVLLWRVNFMRLAIRVRSATMLSRSRLGRLASSVSSVGIPTIPQCPRSPRSQPRNTRMSMAASSRSVLARRCSRDTATLVEWMKCTSMPRVCSHHASQNPSRPAS